MQIQSSFRRSGGIISFLFIAFLLPVLAAAQPAAQPAPPAGSAAHPWADKSLSPDRRAALLIKAMSLDEKIALLHGVTPGGLPRTNDDFIFPTVGYVGYIPANRRLGIPALTLADGRAGVGNGAKDVTLLPSPIAAASSWDLSLMNQFGVTLGKEEWDKGTNVTLSPSIDVVRVPEWGRTFESYGEDPYFNGRMAVAEITGIQSQGSIADANMYVTMNQESSRFSADSVVDERTLEEIYLQPFEAAVTEAHVGTIMCAYVKTNNVYSCENAQVLQDFLRKQLHFDGWVMSDWGATHSTVDAAKNGLDQEMPYDLFFGAPLKQAVLAGQVSVATINDHVRNVLLPMFQHGLFDKAQPGKWTSNVRTPAHDAFSRKVAEEGTVLLKNVAVLPLAPKTAVAVIGAAGTTKPKAEGGGSSDVVAPYVISPIDGIRKRSAAAVTSADGSDLAAAVNAARSAEVAIVFVRTEETEGDDRPDLKLPGNQDALIAAVAAANPKTIVVLDTGGPVLMPWIDQVAGVLQAWYSGQEDGNAIAAILFGDVNPAARLPLTFPRTASAIPTATPEQWPGVGGHSQYTEKLNVGYRWYDATQTDPLFPFGFGLSYTTFSVADLTVSAPTSLAKVTVHLNVTNTGKRSGAEVVQVYVAHPAANGEPPHQLRAFAKVLLKPGETKPVALTLEPRSFQTFDTTTHKWTLQPGVYQILAGTNSRDLPLTSTFTIAATK